GDRGLARRGAVRGTGGHGRHLPPARTQRGRPGGRRRRLRLDLGRSPQVLTVCGILSGVSEDGDTSQQVVEQVSPESELDSELDSGLESELESDDSPEVEVQVPPQDPGAPFVVGIDRDAVVRRREVVRTVERRGAWITLAIGVVGIAAAIYAMLAFRGSGMWPFAILLILAMIPLVLS